MHKGFFNIVIIILISLLIGTAIYLSFTKKIEIPQKQIKNINQITFENKVKPNIINTSTQKQESPQQFETTTEIITSQNETANWKTYIDTNFGWEIKIPPSYKISKTRNDLQQNLKEEGGVVKGNFYEKNNIYSISFTKQLDTSFTPLRFFGNDEPVIKISISKLKQKPNNISMLNYVENILAKPFFDEYFQTTVTPVKNIQKLTLNKKEIIKGSIFVFEGCPKEKYWIEKDTENYIEVVINFCFTQYNSKKLETEKNEINQIISSLNFTNQQTAYKKNKPELYPKITNTKQWWQMEFKNIDWPPDFSSICPVDFAILEREYLNRPLCDRNKEIHISNQNEEIHYYIIQDKNCLDLSSCQTDTTRHLNDQEIELYYFIRRVVKKVAPPNYVLGGRNNDPTDVLIKDLNNDGLLDMIIYLTPKEALKCKSIIQDCWSTDVSNDIFMIVTPIDFDGTSKKLIEVSGKELADLDINPLGGPFEIDGFNDFDNDGKKEIEIYAGIPVVNSIFKIDYDKKTINKVLFHRKNNGIKPVLLGSPKTAYVGVGHFYFKDLDNDNINEYIYEDFDWDVDVYKGPKIRNISIEVYKWNGDIFEYSESLSKKFADENLDNLYKRFSF
jgi:hypothetical protein